MKNTCQQVIDSLARTALSKEAYQGDTLPVVVLYPASSKASAQYVLDTFIRLFKTWQGLDVTPRFNEKITSFIYAAQGNGDDKSADYYKELYEQPTMINYKKDFETLRWPFYPGDNTDSPIIELKDKTGAVLQQANTPLIRNYHLHKSLW